MIKKYYWLDGFDGGEGSKPFDTLEEAKAAAVEHVANIRWTARELAKYRKEWTAFVSIGYIEFLDDAESDSVEKMDGDFIDVDSVDINEQTLWRLY